MAGMSKKRGCSVIEAIFAILGHMKYERCLILFPISCAGKGNRVKLNETMSSVLTPVITIQLNVTCRLLACHLCTKENYMVICETKMVGCS